MKKILSKSKIMVFLLALTLSITIATTSNAAKLTFSHRNNGSNKSSGGSITSSVAQGLMRVDTSIKISGNTTKYRGSDYRSKKYAENYRRVGSTKGSSFCWYYVNGVQKHKSTAWFNFNF